MKPTVWLLVCIVGASMARADDSRLYDADPSHPWNRLSVALHSDAPLRFDGPGEFESRALTGQSYDAALHALDHFLTGHEDRLIRDPMKRAMLQNELWATFDQVSDATGQRQPERNAIARRCARLIKSLALSNAEIAALPDTYARTVRSAAFPTKYDPEHRQHSFLPDDLFAADSAWIVLSAAVNEILQPAAIQHVQATQGRSVFYALVRLPDGRQATLDYLKRLAEFPEPYVPNPAFEQFPYARSAFTLNAALPQFPAGTQVALVRRRIQINSRGELVVSPVVESIQLRVYVIDPNGAQPGAPGNQDFFELELAPASMFAGNGDLRARERPVSTRHLTFEKATVFSMGNNCNNCHGEVGVRSLNTYTHAFGTLPNSPWFEPSSATSQEQNTLHWKQRDYTWGRLSALFESDR